MKNLFARLKNPKIYTSLLLIATVAIVAGAYIFYTAFVQRVFIDDSLVSAPLVSVSPTASGTLTQLDVYEGEQVKKGDPLAIVGGQTFYAQTDGLIVLANNQIGSTVNSQSALVQMVNPQDMRIAGTIDENKGLENIRVGQVVSFTVDALPGQTFWGYVDEISPSAKQTQVSFTISSERPTQQFIVYVKFDAEKYPAIKNGMSAKMIVYTKTK